MPPYITLSIRPLDQAVTIVSFNRPEAANALNVQMALELKDFFEQSTPRRALILTGNGKHFCAGADLKERKGMTEAQWHAQHHAFEGALRALMACPVPVIAAVNGAAFGGGLELALACDFIYAAESARFGLPEATLGIMPGLGGTQSLPRAIGMKRAKELLFTGRAFTAVEALQWGMINRVCSPETLLDEATACAQAIARNAPLSLRAIKRAVNEGHTLPLHEALNTELHHYETLLSSRDRHEGINAFNEKRTPIFKGE